MSNKNSKTNKLPKKVECEQWEMLSPMLNAILAELQVLSKGKPNDALNKFKANSVNKILGKVKDLLSNQPTTEFLELLDEETLPTNSDAVLIMVQFKTAMEQFRTKYYSTDEFSLVSSWKTFG